MPLVTDKATSLGDVFKMQNEVVRLGEANEARGIAGYRVIGRLIELRHELARDANAPGQEGIVGTSAAQQERARAALNKTGLSMDWRHYHNGPMLAVYPARSPQQLLVIGKVNPLPKIPDPDWRESQMVQMSYGQIRASMLSAKEITDLGITLEERPMIEQDFMDHAIGRLRGSATVVVSPLTQALYKVEGLQNMNLIDFSADVYDGTQPAFFVNLETGEAHFHGGKFLMR